MSKKKMSIIYVLRILKTCSSYDYPITQSLLTRAINLAGIKCDRKTIARDIDCLIECGYKIIKYKGGGCYLYDENEFLVLKRTDKKSVFYDLNGKRWSAFER